MKKKNEDLICVVMNVPGQVMLLQDLLDALARLGSQRPWQNVGLALHYGFISLIMIAGVPYVRCERLPV